MSSKISEPNIETESVIVLLAPSSGSVAARGMSLALTTLGVALVGWALLTSDIWRGSANVNGRFCMPLAIGIATSLVGLSIGTTWLTALSWVGVAITGQAASLQMIDAGRLIHFQHYRSSLVSNPDEFAALALFTLQVVAVAAAVAVRHREAIRFLRSVSAWWKLAIIAIVISFSAAAVTPDAGLYLRSLLLGTIVQMAAIGNLILIAWSVPKDSLVWISRWTERILGKRKSGTVSERVRLDRFAVTASLLVFVLTALLSYFVYQGHPHVPDEAQYVFQARYMAAGQLTVAPPADPEAFNMYMVPWQESRWYGIFPPGWPAVLAAGTFFAAGWLVNPILAGVCVLLSYLFFGELYSRRVARIAVILLCCSPWFIFMGMSIMSHMTTLAFGMAGAVLIIRQREKTSLFSSVVAGVSVGMVGITRPLDGAILAALLGVWLSLRALGIKAKLANFTAFGIGVCSIAMLLLVYNRAVTGNFALSPSDAYYSKYFWPNFMALGFGPDRGMHWPLDALPGHSPIEAVINACINAFQVNTELFGWATGSLIFAAVAVASGAIWKCERWAVALIVSVLAAYSLLWYHGGPDFGARYWFLMIIPLIALTVRGLTTLSSKLDGTFLDARLAIVVAVVCISSVFVYIPWRAADKYYRYLGAFPGIQMIAGERGFGRSLVLVRGPEHPDFQSAWVSNPVDFSSDSPIYAHDTDPEITAKLLLAYSDRPIWIVDGPTLAGGEYRIARGPVSAGELIAEF